MLKKEIKLETKRLGTRIKYFTNFSGQTESGGELAYLLVGANNSKKIVESYSDVYTIRNQDNNFKFFSGHSIYEGSVISEEKTLLKQDAKNKIISKYQERIQKEYLNSLGLLTGSTAGLQTYVEFQDIEVNDMYIDISINRSFDNLDTLNIYNNPINDYPEQNATTGVLFGRLTAIQNISDENGEKIQIPLKNTMVGIFNPSEQYPLTTSVDEDGNRLTLNLKENISVNLNSNYSPYFDKDSFLLDYNFLKDTSTLSNIPDMYKYTAMTNENGEFIIHNVPVGEQTFMYEVNLLKHGLTPDEVALNFFSYPTEDNPVIDKVPHYFFRQIPVNILPAWGNNQTGYTELNIKVNIDLRKWATYVVSPIAYKNKTIEEMFADGITTPLTIGIRDMTKKLDPNTRTKVEVVEIADVNDRNLDQAHEWSGEFKQKKNKVEFRSSNFNYFKVPANLYDPNGINSKGEKGVWLAAYQFKMYYGNQNSVYKATGFEREWFPNKALGRNHFDLNKNADFGISNVSIPVGKIGIWPYEKPWTINYPEPYKIPAPPSNFNPNKQYDSDGNGGNGWASKPEDPLFLDGDYPGHFVASNILQSGYGSQNIGGSYTYNQFSREVTTHGIYKYEAVDQWDEQWSNGFVPVIDNPIRQQNGLPTADVLNGEKWQRVECGYIYWLKPEGWPRVTTYGGWVDLLSDGDQSRLAPPTSQNWGPNTYADGIYKSRENILIRMDSSAPFWNVGALDIYRIVDSKKISQRLAPPEEKFAIINVQRLISEIRRTRFTGIPSWLTLGSPTIRHAQCYEVSQASVKIKNVGTNKVTIALGSDVVELEQNQEFYFQDSISSYTQIKLPGNSGYNSETNSYDKAKYQITFWSIQTDVNSGGPYAVNTGDIGYGGYIETDLKTDIESNIPIYYLVQVVPTIVNMTGEHMFGNGTKNTDLLPNRVAINGFMYCLWSYGWPMAKQGSNDWVCTYYPGYPVYTKNPYLYLLDEPLPAAGYTYSPGNLDYGYI